MKKKFSRLNIDDGKKFVTISTKFDLSKEYYTFYLPIVCQSWRRVGFEPIIIIVISDVNIIQNKPFSTRLNLSQLKVIEYLKILNVKIFYLKSEKNYEITLSMISRIFIGFICQSYILNENAFYLIKRLGPNSNKCQLLQLQQ